MQEHQAKVINKNFIADDVVTLDLEIGERDFSFSPGQFVQFKIGNVYRAYSITSTLSDLPKLSFLIELIEDGVGSNYIRDLQVGDRVLFRGALGLFAPKETEQHHFYIATGVGIAPFRPIIKYLSEKDHQQMLLLFGGRVQERLWFRDEFLSVNGRSKLEYHETVTRPNEAWTGLRGRVTDHLPALYQSHSEAVFHVCGGKEMVTDVRTWLMGQGHNPAKIKLEIFF